MRSLTEKNRAKKAPNNMKYSAHMKYQAKRGKMSCRRASVAVDNFAFAVAALLSTKLHDRSTLCMRCDGPALSGNTRLSYLDHTKPDQTVLLSGNEA